MATAIVDSCSRVEDGDSPLHARAPGCGDIRVTRSSKVEEGGKGTMQ